MQRLKAAAGPDYATLVLALKARVAELEAELEKSKRERKKRGKK